MNFGELKSALFARSNFGVKLGLERMQEALRLLGDPHLAAPALHVAGTNGKGSTCAFAEASLRAAGLRTGLYTSPHLNHFCERIRIGGATVSEERACELLEEVLRRVPWTLDDPGLTFFEIVTLMGFLAFRDVDVMVVEVGLGGRLDATNVLLRPAACAVTALGIEHAEYLGPTLAQIAAEKAGIFKRGSPAVSVSQPPEAMEILQEKARPLGIALRISPPYQGKVSLAGEHQRANAGLAVALLEASGLRHDAATGLATAVWPGRLEQFGNVYLDGAHNPHAAAALARSLPELGRPLHLVFGALQDKDAAAMLRELAPHAASVHYCAPDSPRAIAPQALACSWPGTAHPTPAAALEAARSQPGVVLACGSLYLVAELRALLLGEARAPMPSERL
ncbi:MAG TPA: folylpolyglutamate synthase/dihydrofolate synthase family protein [Myxococcales bacterium]